MKKAAIKSKEFGGRVRARREFLGLNQRQLAEKVGVQSSHISLLENGRSGVSKPALVQLAVALKTSPSELIGDREIAPLNSSFVSEDLTGEESHLVRCYRRASRADQRTLLRFAAFLGPVTSAEEKAHPSAPISQSNDVEDYRYLQFLDAAAGLPCNSEARFEEIAVPTYLAPGPDFHIARARGDSMTGIGIENGDILLVELVSSTKNYQVGDVVIARVGESDYAVKRYGGHRRGKRYLLSENDAVETMAVDDATCIIEAVVVAHRTKSGVWLIVSPASVKGRL